MSVSKRKGRAAAPEGDRKRAATPDPPSSLPEGVKRRKRSASLPTPQNEESSHQRSDSHEWSTSDLPNKLIYCSALERPTSGVDVVAVSPDGRDFLAVGRANGQIDILSLPLSCLVTSLPGGQNVSIRFLRFLQKRSAEPSPLKKPSLLDYCLISTGLHGVISIWSIRRKCVVFETPSYGGAVFSGDVLTTDQSTLFAFACDDGAPRLFELENDDEDDPSEFSLRLSSKSLPKHSGGRLLSACFFDSSTLFCGSADSRILRWSLKTGLLNAHPMTVNRRIVAKQTRETQVWALCALPTYGCLVSGDSLGNVTFWDVKTLTVSKTFSAHESEVMSILSHHDKFVVSGGLDGSIKLFKVGPNSQYLYLGPRPSHCQEIRCLALTTIIEDCEGTLDAVPTLAYGGSDSRVQLMTSPERLNPRIFVLPNLSGCVTKSYYDLAIAPFQSSVSFLALAANAALEVWALATPDPLAEKARPPTNCLQLVKTALIELEAEGVGGAISSCCISARKNCVTQTEEGRVLRIAVASEAQGVRVFDLNLREDIASVTKLKGKFWRRELSKVVCSSLALLDSAQKMIGCVVSSRNTKGSPSRSGGVGSSMVLRLWDLNTEQTLVDLPVSSAVEKLIVSPNEKYIAARHVDGSVNLYSQEKESLKHVYEFPRFPTSYLQIHSEMTAGYEVGCYVGHVTFSPDNETLMVWRRCGARFMLYNLEKRKQCTDLYYENDLKYIQSTGVFEILKVKGMSQLGSILHLQLPTQTTTENVLILIYENSAVVTTVRYRIENKIITAQVIKQQDQNVTCDHLLSLVLPRDKNSYLPIIFNQN